MESQFPVKLAKLRTDLMEAKTYEEVYRLIQNEQSN